MSPNIFKKKTSLRPVASTFTLFQNAYALIHPDIPICRAHIVQKSRGPKPRFIQSIKAINRPFAARDEQVNEKQLIDLDRSQFCDP